VFVVQAVDFEALGDSPSSSRVRAVVPPVTRGNCISGTIARAPTCNYLRARTLYGSNNEYEITKPRMKKQYVFPIVQQLIRLVGMSYLRGITFAELLRYFSSLLSNCLSNRESNSNFQLA
jgi:hypothetical protein